MLDWSPKVFVVVLVVSVMVFVVVVLLMIPPGERDSPPEITFESNRTAAMLIINFTQEGIVWDDLQVQLSAPGGFMIGDESNVTRVQEGVFVRLANDIPVQPGDRIRFCLDDPEADLEVVLRHRDTGDTIARWIFEQVVACQRLLEDLEGPLDS